MEESISMEFRPEMTEAVRRFAALPPERQETALLIMRGVQIGEDIARKPAHLVQPPESRPSL